MYKTMDRQEMVGQIPAALVSESVSSLKASHCDLAVRVDAVQMLKIASLTSKWEQKQYIVTVNDCVAYAADVAGILGLAVPPRDGLETFPVLFINSLADYNTTPAKLKEYAELQKQRQKPPAKKRTKPLSPSSNEPREIIPPHERRPSQPTGDKPAPDKPAPDKPAPDKPAPEKPAPDKPAPDKPPPEKPTPDRPRPEPIPMPPRT